MKVVTFYGHKFNGNLKAFADYCLEKNEFVLQFAALDSAYYEQQKGREAGVEFLSLRKLKDVIKISKSDIVIADRRAHALLYYLWLTRIPFVDVWHGIQVFKKFAPKRMAMLEKYSEIWVPSQELAKVYINDYGIDKNKVKVTGYARVDSLVKGNYSPKIIRSKYGIEDKYKKIILLAPTWQQNDPTRQIIPFGADPQEFLGALNKIASKHRALVIFRVHLNTNSQNRSNVKNMSNIRVMSHNDYPVAEEFLALSDLFIGDWSSIAFDYLPLHKPAIFLDAPVPFTSGLTFEEEHRYGEIVESIDELVQSIDKYISNPDQFKQKYAKQIRRTEEVAYGNTLDGKSSERYYKRLQKILSVK